MISDRKGLSLKKQLETLNDFIVDMGSIPEKSYQYLNELLRMMLRYREKEESDHQRKGEENR